MPQPSEITLAELLCARLCHDLAGPVGAVATGAELLTEEDDSIGGEALALLETSAQAAGSRLRFLRQAFGAGTAPVQAATVRDLSRSYFDGPPPEMGGIRLAWSDGDVGAFAPTEAKLILNMLLLAQDGLPRGGVITVRLRDGHSGLATVEAEGRGATAGAALVGVTADEPSELNSRQAQGYYSAKLAEALGLNLETQVENGCLRLKAW